MIEPRCRGSETLSRHRNFNPGVAIGMQKRQRVRRSPSGIGAAG